MILVIEYYPSINCSLSLRKTEQKGCLIASTKITLLNTIIEYLCIDNEHINCVFSRDIFDLFLCKIIILIEN